MTEHDLAPIEDRSGQDEGSGKAAGTPDQDRLIVWFAQWRKPICSWLRDRALIPPGDIDDLTQEVFLRLLRYSDDIAVENPQGYLFRIAANVAHEWRGRPRLRRPHDDSWLEAFANRVRR